MITFPRPLLLLSLATAILAQEPPCAACTEWNAPQEPFRVFGNTYYVGPHGLSSILVTSPAGHILIDAALPESAPQIADRIRSLGFRVEDVKWIVNSHVHFDHGGGIAALQKITGAQVAASPWSADVLTRTGIGRDDPQFGVLPRTALVPNAHVLRDRETLKVGDLSVTAHFTPGHTPGGTSWTWKSCEGRRCLNLIYSDSMTSVSADDYHYSGHPAAVDGFRKSFKFLREASCDILLTAHPDFSQLWARLERRQKGDANAMVDPKACRALADRSEEQLRQRLYSEQPHIYPTFPDKIDPLGRYVFYSHGLIVEGTDERPVHPENGVYDFPAIKQAIFKDGGFNLIAFHRPKNADAKAYAAMLEEWVRKLLKAGVPASRITIVGFSRGSGITAYAAARLRDTGIQTALMGACSNGDIPGGDALKLGGNLLNIYETTDTVLSCNVLAKRSDLKSFKEVAISTGKKHGAFFTPREEWIGPLKTWIRETNK